MRHALVIGGTGMLSEAVLWLVTKGYKVTVVARNRGGLEKLVKQSGGKINPISVDYYNVEDFRGKLSRAVFEIGEPELVVCWMRSDANAAFQVLLEEAGPKAEPWSLFHVRSSTGWLDQTPVDVPEFCNYHMVYLGFILEGGSSRWLTNHEISAGVIEAIQVKEEEFVVGTIEPWEMRP